MWRVSRKLGAKSVGLIAAGIAFYGLLSLFPAITAAVAIVGIYYDSTVLLANADWILSATPEATRSMISGQIAEVADAREQSLGWAALLAIAIAFWSASRGMGSMVEGLNAVYDEEEKRGFIALKLTTLGLTISLIIGLTLAVAVVAAIPAALAFVVGSDAMAGQALAIRWPALMVVGIAGFAVLYRFGPSRRKATWRWLSPGAVLACLLWVAGSLGFSFYVQQFGSYNETFGALGGVVVMLTWLWLSAFVVLLGALVDAELEAQTRKDSTVGPDKPMGERGAVKADTLGETLASDE